MARIRIVSRLERERSEDFLEHRFCSVGAAMIGSAVIGGVASASAASKGAKASQSAADSQSASAMAGIAEQQRQFDAVREMLNPFAEAGHAALEQQQRLTGIYGTDAQQSAISALQQSPGFQSQLQRGENSILSNASATGGLRGGNTQAALAQFSPQLLAQTINDQYARLGGLTSLGQNAAAGVGNAGMSTGNQISALLQQQGAAQAGGAIGSANAYAQGMNGISKAAGFVGANWSGFGGSSAPVGITGGTVGFGGTTAPGGFGQGALMPITTSF